MVVVIAAVISIDKDKAAYEQLNRVCATHAFLFFYSSKSKPKRKGKLKVHRKATKVAKT